MLRKYAVVFASHPLHELFDLVTLLSLGLNCLGVLLILRLGCPGRTRAGPAPIVLSWLPFVLLPPPLPSPSGVMTSPSADMVPPVPLAIVEPASSSSSLEPELVAVVTLVFAVAAALGSPEAEPVAADAVTVVLAVDGLSGPDPEPAAVEPVATEPLGRVRAALGHQDPRTARAGGAGTAACNPGHVVAAAGARAAGTAARAVRLAADGGQGDVGGVSSGGGQGRQRRRRRRRGRAGDAVGGRSD